MDVLHEQGVYFEIWLQKVMSNHAHRFLSITKVGDPDLLILYLFPLVSAIHRTLFLRFVLATAFCDMLNNIMKWILRGDRPYWWVYEHNKEDTMGALEQFPLTCETGPGSPSGHAMITASVWYIIVWAYIKYIVGRSRQRTILSRCAWSMYATLLMLVAISRLYIATHFPHQVLLGSAIGFTVGWYFCNYEVKQLRMRHCLTLASALSICAMLVYVAMLIFGVDPQWSVRLAQKWCRNSEWVHLTTSPLNALFRDIGAIVGLGLAVDSSIYAATTYDIHRDGSEVISALVSFVLVQMCAALPRSFDSLPLYYATTFVQNALISFVSVALVPYVVQKIWNLHHFPRTMHDPASVGSGYKAKRKLTAYF